MVKGTFEKTTVAKATIKFDIPVLVCVTRGIYFTTLVGSWGKKESSLSFDQWLKWVEPNVPNFATVWEMILLGHADHLIEAMTKVCNYAS